MFSILFILLHSLSCAIACDIDCLQFDPSMFANTIDEALYNFPNLVSNVQKPLFNKVAPKRSRKQMVSDDDCNDVSCKACKLHVINGFLSDALDPSTNSSLWATKISLEASLKGITPSCPHNSITQNSTIHRDKRGGGRPGMIGTTQSITCEYRRGTPLSDETKFCGLCSLCWGWRQLPENYFPHFLNEVHCASDNTCLKGFGRCNPVTRSVNVLVKKTDASGTVKYQPVSIDTVIGCECQVEAGSALYDLAYSNP